MASARLSNLKRLLRETTQEAYQSIVPTNDSIITPPGSDISTKPEDDASGDANKAGHEMGLLLFGTSREYKEQMENEFTEKLEGIEREVASIREELGQLQGSSGGARDVSMTMEATNDGAEEIDLSSLNPTELQNHIEFLQLCSSSQRLLDQVDSTSFSSEKVALDFSPSSMLFSPSSSTNGKFNFDNANQGGSVENAAKLVLKVEGELDKATRLLDMDNNEEENQIHEMHLAIYNELRFQFRRKKMELKHRAISTLEGCIVVELGKLCVRGAVGTKKNVNFGDFDTAAPATPRENAIHSPLGDAYVVLEVFNNDQYPVLGETLDQAIKTIGKQLFGQVFQPTLKELDMSNGSVGYYKFNQEIVKNSIGSRKYDTAVTRGQAIQLLWEMNKVASSVSFTAGKPDVIISTSTEINEAELLASSPLASVTNFISCLNFVLKVLEFVHEHVLLQRTDLAKLLGNYLFGLYPISPSLSAGSAILGGVLVGAAAQGEDTGEVRPLMVELVKCMRDWCIPDDSNLEVWRTVPKIQRVLVQEVSAFENRLVEMGYLNARENVRKFGAASSPSGLSVLVNQDGIRSPIDVNLTVNRDSPMEVSSPPTEQDKENMFVRSSLSETAHSFIQAYSENQRSKILRHGRTVLDSTDYHNSVQVGKFVPPPSEPGTLEHLDEDPLDAFVFHQCSISLTAKKTLQLVRQTLDEAVQPEMSQELDALPPMLYRASRELLDLFRAVVPTLYASEIGTIPRMAAIHHNDCVFLAHEASLLGAEYKPKVRSNDETHNNKARLLFDICTFVDMVPPFRDLANKSMGSMLDVQKDQLSQLITPRIASFKESLSSNESVSEWDDAETALRAALYHLRHLSQSWSQVLSREVYHLAIGNLVDTIFTLLLDPVMSSEAITDAASRFVHSLFLDAVKSCAEVFFVGKLAYEDTSKQIDVAGKYSMLIKKVHCIGQFMAMRLDDINRGLEDGLFCTVTGKELSHLITATYDESAKRNALLKYLRSQ